MWVNLGDLSMTLLWTTLGRPIEPRMQQARSVGGQCHVGQPSYRWSWIPVGRQPQHTTTICAGPCIGREPGRDRVLISKPSPGIRPCRRTHCSRRFLWQCWELNRAMVRPLSRPPLTLLPPATAVRAAIGRWQLLHKVSKVVDGIDNVWILLNDRREAPRIN